MSRLMESRVTILMGTIGRGTLPRALESLHIGGFRDGDELILVGHGEWRWSAEVFEKSGFPGVFAYLPIPPGKSRDDGYWDCGAPRVLARKIARKDSIWLYLDDDDCYLPDGINIMREAAFGEQDAMHVFKIRWANGEDVYAPPDHSPDALPFPHCIATVAERSGEFGTGHTDFRMFARNTFGLCGGRVRRHPEAVIATRPHLRQE